ncbi:MAG: class I SAM-dependent methyltransferase [Thermomicrobiales bacterium]
MTLHAWQPNEMDYAGPEHLDPGYIPGYDEKAQTDPKPDLDLLIAAGLQSDHTVIDLGAGTGTFALAAAAVAARVIAVDISAQMLASLQTRINTSPARTIELVHAGFLSYEHTGDLADFVYSRHALHHLPDFWKAIALNRMASFLKPGGTLLLRDLVYSFEPQDAEAKFDRWLGNASATSDRGWTRQELEIHIREEFSTFTWLLEPMIERAGFDIVAAYERESFFYAAYVCRKRSI